MVAMLLTFEIQFFRTTQKDKLWILKSLAALYCHCGWNLEVRLVILSQGPPFFVVSAILGSIFQKPPIRAEVVWDFLNSISSPSSLSIRSISLDGCLEILRSEFFFNESSFRVLVVCNYCISSLHNCETVREIQNNPTAILRVGRFLLAF